ncbi:MAG: sigma-70 family RNA polymerase sigma factor [Saprospiraceae bacterium]|nr:sigma-70 family RNA polymerase sigma factor [Saprospiraceae bacterium]
MTEKGPYTEKALVEGCIRNDRRCQEAFYRKFFDTMFRMVSRYTDDRDLAMEIVNNGFLRVFQKLDTFTFSGSLEGWVRRLVFHALSDHFRRQPKNVHFIDLEERDAPVSGNVLNSLYFEDIIKLVDMLPNASREVFWLYAIEGYPHAEIGKRLHISEGTSKWHLSMARQKLKELLHTHYNLNYHAG